MKQSDNGKPLYDTKGNHIKEHILMGHTTFSDGQFQPLYFPNDHPTCLGLFKGIAIILEGVIMMHATSQQNAQGSSARKLTMANMDAAAVVTSSSMSQIL